jgi:YhcH/YjgK/YiaL family protein
MKHTYNNRKRFLLTAFLCLSFGFAQLAAQTAPKEWSARKAKKWFQKKEWLQQLSLQPHASIDKVKFATQYHANRPAWEKAFTYIKNTDLEKLPNGRHTIDGTNVYALVSEAPTKDYDKTAFESHEKYIDLQLVIRGTEAMAKVPVSSVTIDKAYNETADIAFYKGDGKPFLVPASSFTLFFPTEAHRPNITPSGNQVVKKVVIKIKAAE